MKMDREILMLFIFQSKGLGNHAVVCRLELCSRCECFVLWFLEVIHFSQALFTVPGMDSEKLQRGSISQQNFRSLQLCDSHKFEDSILVPVLGKRKGFVK